MTDSGPASKQKSDDRQHADSQSLAPNSPKITSSSKHAKVLPPTAEPVVRTFFDPWNSSSTGHQRAENRLSGSTSWRVSRSLKLGEQYNGGLGGGRRIADTVGAGSEDFGKDGRTANGGWEKGAKGLRTGGQKSLSEVWGASKAGKRSSQEKKHSEVESIRTENTHLPKDESLDHDTETASEPDRRSSTPSEKQIFAGLCMYINGSTAPLVSDHKLKHLLAAHGAKFSIVLGRRTVTHVVLGTANVNGGAGGGLAATKIQKETVRSGGKAVKFVTAEWVLESIKASRRLPELRFSPLKLAAKNQQSVLSMMHASRASSEQR